MSGWINNMEEAGLTVDFPSVDTEIEMESVPQPNGEAVDYAKLHFTVYDEGRKLCTESNNGAAAKGKKGRKANYYLVRIEHDCCAQNFMRSSVVMKSAVNKGALEDVAEFQISTCPPEGCDVPSSP